MRKPIVVRYSGERVVVRFLISVQTNLHAVRSSPQVLSSLCVCLSHFASPATSPPPPTPQPSYSPSPSRHPAAARNRISHKTASTSLPCSSFPMTHSDSATSTTTSLQIPSHSSLSPTKPGGASCRTKKTSSAPSAQ
jgi:hypothetical protein